MAAVFKPEQLGITPPTGGFKEGGWYSGRQYWGGTLSDPGTIHPSSNQIGAGQAVSPEVIAQTSPANVAYIEQERQKQQKLNIQPMVQIAPTQQPTVPAQPATSAGTAGTAGLMTPQPTINLPDMYKNLYATSGISEKETQYSQMEKEFIEAKGKINDNPFLSEATRVGRVAKLETLFTERTANIKNEIATKKADIETQLNLQTKQLDINSQAAQLALSQFNTLLSLGALEGASGEDIANITRSTGISSSMIYSAIEANKKKNVSTSTIQYDDGTNQGFVVINSNTGEIINKQVVAESKPKAESVTGQKNADLQQSTQNLINDIQRGATLKDLVNHYAVAGGLTVEEIYRLYNSYSPYGTAKEKIEAVKQGKFVS